MEIYLLFIIKFFMIDYILLILNVHIYIIALKFSVGPGNSLGLFYFYKMVCFEFLVTVKIYFWISLLKKD